MVAIFIIMGAKGTRKSPTIRALTGAYNSGVYPISTLNLGDIDIFVQIPSLQEDRISPQVFITKVTQNNYSYVLVSLRINSTATQPDGLVYLQQFQNARWNVQEIAILGPHPLPYQLPLTHHYIRNSQTIPANNTASQVRGIWQWL